MKSFQSFLEEGTTEGKNSHMMHLSDAVVYGGVDGTRNAINSLRAMRDILAGSSKGTHNTSVKLDGAPSIIAGTDPSDGKFFVAKKGVFNKNPKVYKTAADVDADTTGELADKLKTALKYFPKLGIKGILQGDLMFTANDLKKETIDGEKYITFHPNTIVYAILEDSHLGKKIKASKIGVVWHTKYTGDSFATMTASFNADTTYLKDVKEVWHQDANVRDLSGNIQFTKKDTDDITKILSDAGKIFSKLSSTTLKEISDNTEIAKLMEIFTNSFVRKGEDLPSPEFRTNALLDWIDARFEKEKEKRKSEKGKAGVHAQKEEILKFFSSENMTNLKLLFELQSKLVEATMMILHKLESIKKFKTFVKTADGFKVTKEEGYVVTDILTNGAYKLVDRLEFSRNNFDPEILKGWVK